MMEVVVLRAASHSSCSPDNIRLSMDPHAKRQRPLCPIPVLWHHVQQMTVFVSAVFFTEHQYVSEPSWLPVLPANGNQMALRGRFRGLIYWLLLLLLGVCGGGKRRREGRGRGCFSGQ